MRKMLALSRGANGESVSASEAIPPGGEGCVVCHSRACSSKPEPVCGRAKFKNINFRLASVP